MAPFLSQDFWGYATEYAVYHNTTKRTTQVLTKQWLESFCIESDWFFLRKMLLKPGACYKYVTL